MDVSDFLANISLSKDFARPNKYSVEMYPPTGVTIDSTTLRSICLNCKGATFPGKTVDAVQFVGGGYIARQMPFGFTYPPITLTFYLSSDHKEKTFFEEWKKLIYNETTNTLNYYDNYVGSMVVTQLSRANNPKKSYQLFECYPSSVTEVNVGADMENAVAEVIVTINYRKYKDIQS